MSEQIEALLALSKTGTMAAAALRLRVTSSAISKRISSLERQLGYRVIEPRGRRVELTAKGAEFASRAEPLIREMRSLLDGESSGGVGDAVTELKIGVTESVLASWGAAWLVRAAGQCAGVRLEIHAHRSPVVLEKVRAGELTVGVCAGLREGVADLRVDRICEEPMVLVPSKDKEFRIDRKRPLEVIGIESHAMTAMSLRAGIRRLAQESGLELVVAREVESYSCIVQLAKAGFGHGLVPEGIAAAMGVRNPVRIPRPGLSRFIGLAVRKTAFERSAVREFCLALSSARESAVRP